MKNMFIKNQYLRKILTGEKKLETRVGYPRYNFNKGDVICLNYKLLIKVKDIRKYYNYKTALDNEDPKNIIPGCNQKEALEVCNKIYPDWKQKSMEFWLWKLKL